MRHGWDMEPLHLQSALPHGLHQFVVSNPQLDEWSRDFSCKSTGKSSWIDRLHPPSQVYLESSNLKSHSYLSDSCDVRNLKDDDDNSQLWSDDWKPNLILQSLKTCGKQKDLSSGHRIHAGLLERGWYHKDIYVSNALISMYVKCDTLEKAQHVFDELPIQTAAAFNALILGYSQHGLINQALSYVRQMQENHLTPDVATLACLLKACGSIRSIKLGERIHFEVNKLGLFEESIIIGTALLDMYAKCGALKKAKHVFDKLPVRDVISWNALIAMYVYHGLYDDAMDYFIQMVNEGFTPDGATLTCILKVCSRIRLLEKGEEIHHEVRKNGLLQKNSVLGTALVDMYTKCGMLMKAQEVFDELPARNTISWNVLIAGYAENALGFEAPNCFKRMQEESVLPNAITFASILQAYGNILLIRKGEEIHAQVRNLGFLESDIVLGTALTGMYAKCGAVEKAEKLFSELPKHDIILWNTLISGYNQHNHADNSLICFERMQHQGICPNEITFTCILKACIICGSVEKGKEIHAQAKMQVFSNDALSTALVDMYAKCGELEKAEEVFNELPLKNASSWNAMIVGYVHNQLFNEAIACFENMRDKGHLPDAITFSSILKACGSLGLHLKGEEIHVEVSQQGLLKKNVVLGSALVDMYAKCGEFVKARMVLDEIQTRDVISWTALIGGYVEHGLIHEALNCYEQMQLEGLLPNIVTFLSLLKACANIRSIEMGEEIKEQIGRLRLLGKSNVLENGLIDMYAKCDVLFKAQGIFDNLSSRDVVSWNSLIAGYVQHGLGEKALDFFGQMQEQGYFPDAITFSCILKACGSLRMVKKGEAIHAIIVKLFIINGNAVLANGLVDFYAKCGGIAKAQEVFDEILVRDVISWNALIAGFSQYGQDHEALNYFCRMLDEGVVPDSITFSCILKSCSNLGCAKKGEEIHAEVNKQGMAAKGMVLGTALVTMYAKCGVLTRAQEVFDDLTMRDVVAWTALIAGYAQFSYVKQVLILFNKMIAEGTTPDLITFVVLLTVCSHAGLMEEAMMYFDTMSTVYGLNPTIEHYTCMVDLFSRAGHFDKAMAIMESVPICGCISMWIAFLGGCGKWENVNLAKWAFDLSLPRIPQCESYTATMYVYMSNIYAGAGTDDEVDKIDAL